MTIYTCSTLAGEFYKFEGDTFGSSIAELA